MSREPRVYLHDILECCEKVLRYSRGMTRDSLREDEMRHDAIIRNLLVIGEAAKNVPDEVREDIRGVDWRGVAGLRDVLIHAYFRIDDDTMWTVVHEHLPGLRDSVRTYLDRA